MDTYNNKTYQTYQVEESLFRGYVVYNDEEYEMSLDLLKKLCKDLGFSHDLYLTLISLDRETADKLLDSMCRRSGHSEVTLLLEDNSQSVVGYTFDNTREPLLNDTFITRLNSIITSSDAIEMTEVYYSASDTVSTALIKKKDPIFVEEKRGDGENIVSETIPYNVGVLIINDELGTTSCRFVVYVGGQPIYLPASVYSVTTSRYKRSTSSTTEALEVLILKIIDDLREDSMQSKINDLHLRYRYNKNVVVSYEEYNTILNTMRKIPSVIEDNSVLSSIMDLSDAYERRYMNLIDKKSSYIWRCTALGDICLENLISIICSILVEMNAPPIQYFNIRDLLGYYVSTPRIAEDIAKGSTKEV